MENLRKSRFVQSIFVCLCLTIFCVYFYLNWDYVSLLVLQLGWSEAGIIFLTIAMQIGIRVWCEKLHYSSIGYEIPASFLYPVQSRQNILNYLPMKAGTIYSAAILKARYKIPLSHFTAVFAAQNILALAITLLAASFALFLTSPDISKDYITGLILALSGLLTFSILFFRIPTFSKLPVKIKIYVDMLNSGIAKCKSKPGLLTAMVLLRLMSVLFMAWRFQILFALSGQTIAYSTSLIFCASILISLLISITPAGIGIREVLLAATSGLLTHSAAIAVIVSVFDRILVLLFSAIVVLADYGYGIFKFRQ